MNRIVFTCGDINGIGPEISIKAIQKVYNPKKVKIILAIPADIFHDYKLRLGFDIPSEYIKDSAYYNTNAEIVSVIDLGKAKLSIGKPTKHSGSIAYKSIAASYNLIQKGLADAMVTAPISKSAFEKAGLHYPGHTEMLAEWSNSKNYAMTFISKRMNCALISIHDPIKSVPKKITKTRINSVLHTVIKSLKYDFKIPDPKIAVLGLNPHAGESGRIGSEEIEIILPALKNIKDVKIDGPFVPDAFFANKLYKLYDMVIGMYHDQVLIPFKLMNFNSGVNFTAGLNIIRTSPDHGTAFDIAGKIIADDSSMVEAFKAAVKISNNRKKN